MFFINQEHTDNFILLVRNFNAVNNPEYRSSLYILSLPEIFKKIRNYIMNSDNPMEWYFSLKEGEVKIDFSSGYLKILNLAANLWNSTDFNLCSGLETWDENLMRVFQTACVLRRYEGKDLVLELI